jgi:hypothetical protein
MRGRRYHIRLNEGEREKLGEVIRGSGEKGRIVRAHVLLELDEGSNGEKLPDREEIARRCRCTASTVYRISRLYAREGIGRTLDRKLQERRGGAPPVPEEAAEKIRALFDGEIPAGRKRWTLRLLAAKAVEVGIVGRISSPTVAWILRMREQ